MSLRNSPKDLRGLGQQSDVSSTQQFHFPTALPPPISSHPLSSGLNSAFAYDGLSVCCLSVFNNFIPYHCSC